MNLRVGIVGLPNVGKSTLFNALLKKQQAYVANYPFATIEPNVGIVPVPDLRLERLAQITKEEEKMSGFPPIKPAVVNFVDIAGLVKGASVGAGLGNKFLSHIREVSIICHVIRAFEDSNIIRYQDNVDPRLQSPEATADGGQAKSDYETINTELILADIESVQKSKIINAKKTSILDSIDGKKREAIEKIINSLNKGIPVRDMHLSGEEQELLREFFLLSAKPELIVLNIAESDYSENKFKKIYSRYTSISSVDKMVVVCAKIESDLSELAEIEQKEYLQGLGLKESGLERLIQKAYATLELISFLTAGEKEVRAWTIQKGMTASNAAGVIHTDFAKNFIKAEVVSYEDFVNLNGWKGAREKGKARLEGRDYIMRDGDVVEFKIGN